MTESLPGQDALWLKVLPFKRLRFQTTVCIIILLGVCLFSSTLLSASPDSSVTADSAVSMTAGTDSSLADSADRKAAADSLVQRLSLDNSSSSNPLDLSYQRPDSVFSVKNISMVMIVIGLLVLFLHFLRKFLFRPLGATLSGGQFQVVRQFHLGPKKSVTLVRFAGRLLLLGVTDSNITTLAEIDDPQEVERILSESSGADSAQGGGFKDIYQNLLSRAKKNR